MQNVESLLIKAAASVTVPDVVVKERAIVSKAIVSPHHLVHRCLQHCLVQLVHDGEKVLNRFFL